MTRITLLTLLTLSLSLLSPSFCTAQSASHSYLPLSGREMGRRFAVRYLGTTNEGGPGQPGSPRETALPGRMDVGPAGASVEKTEEGALVVVGKDRGGAAWRVHLGGSAAVYASRFYASDLDGDGVRDLVFIFPTGGNGLAPSSHFYSLTFDARGRPVPFEADGYFQEDGRGIQDLVDLDGDRRAELIYMNFDDGYWVTNLYEVEGGRWRRVEGRHGDRSFPLYTRFTRRSNRTPTTPRPGRRPFAPDLSNHVPVLSGALDSYEWGNLEQSEDVKLSVSAGGSKTVCSPVSWYASFGVVTDTPQGREVISAYGNEEQVKALLDQAVKNRTALRLYGRRQRELCSPEWIWLGD